MFFVEGWLTIYQVWGTFIRFRISHPDLQEYPRGEHPFKGPAWDQFLEDFFGLCISCDDVGILLSNGETVLADSFFLYSFSIEDKAHRYFSIPRGIVGHGSLSERFVAEEIEEDFSKKSLIARILGYSYMVGSKSGARSSVKASIEESIQGFVGARVIFRDRDVQDYLKAMAGDKPEPVSEKRCAALIVAAFDRGESVNKTSAKQDYGSNLGQRAFLRAWQIATAERPDLSKPGRPKQK